ncbi:alpha/beta hydrolase [Succinimonas amylolytica]|uniref:alpha/beta hydrolase n=1 Tax=Succinimonas amylolytica TaxID=83769 RepID=UPI0023A8B7E3
MKTPINPFRLLRTGMLAAATVFLLAVSACGTLPEPSSLKGLSLEGQSRQEYIAERINGYFHPAAGEVPVPPFAAPSGISHRCFNANGVKLETLSREGAAGGRVVLQLHGGGYILPLTDLYRMWGVMQLEQAAAGMLVMVDYRISPGHQYPAALEDALSAYRYILEQGVRAGDIVVMGDSAGGNLALALAVQLRELGLPEPGAMVLFSPWTAMTADYPSRETNRERDLVLGAIANPVMYHEVRQPSYAGAVPLADPRLSPVNADLSGLPPLLIQAGQYDMFMDEAMDLLRKVSAAGGEARFTVYPGMPHDFQIFMPELQESIDSFREVADFIDAHYRAGVKR